jgi:hypothetical protein
MFQKRSQKTGFTFEKNVAVLSLAWIFAAAFSRWIPHPPNFTAIGAVAVLGGIAYSSRLWALLVPVLALLTSDLVLGFHSTMVWVYGAVMVVSLIAPLVLERVNAFRLGGMAVLSTALFFLITNFGVWATGSLYPMTAEGLLMSYVAAIPFSLNQLLADFFFIPVAVVSFEWARAHVRVAV